MALRSMNGKHVLLLGGGLVGLFVVSLAAGCGHQPGIGERSARGGPAPLSPVDPYTRGRGHWLFECEGREMGHQWGERVADPKASGGGAWGTPKELRTSAGVLVFGPYYRRLPAGKYRVDFHLRIEQTRACASGAC